VVRPDLERARFRSTKSALDLAWTSLWPVYMHDSVIVSIGRSVCLCCQYAVKPAAKHMKCVNPGMYMSSSADIAERRRCAVAQMAPSLVLLGSRGNWSEKLQTSGLNPLHVENILDIIQCPQKTLLAEGFKVGEELWVNCSLSI